MANQRTAGLVESHSETTTDEGQISTLVLFVESGTRDAASAASYSAIFTSVMSHPFTSMRPQTLSLANAVKVASPSPSNRSALSMRPLRAHRDVPVRSAFSAMACTGRREAKKLMTATTVVDKRVSSRGELVSTGVRLPPRDAPSPSLYSTDDEVACLTGAKENYALSLIHI